MLAVAGTVPDQELGVLAGPAELKNGTLVVEGRGVEINRGTPALIAAALSAIGAAGRAGGDEGVFAFLAGDIGTGQGSRMLYQYLADSLPSLSFSALAFHYLQPEVDGHGQVLLAVGEMASTPLLIADAGFMYAAKMSGQASSYDLFTPDAGELAFLADPEAPHPFYTRGFILHQEEQVPQLIARAYAHGNAARNLLIKGRRDYLAAGPENMLTLNGPSHPAMEAIGGTGDTLTGMAAALAAAGMEVGRSARAAALANRLAGAMTKPTPATQISELIARLPDALGQALDALEKAES